MKLLKQVLNYLIWIVLALACGLVHVRIVLGASPETTGDSITFSKLIYDFVLIHVGLRIGGIIAILFILLDLFYLKKKLRTTLKSTLIRFLILIGISITVGVTHYILEKVIDVI